MAQIYVRKSSLQGEFRISGSKNAALPIIAASTLNSSKVILNNVPNLSDVHIMSNLIGGFGGNVSYENGSLSVHIKDAQSVVAPYELVSAMRASILILGALLGRFKQAKVALPGGCNLGQRAIDLHIASLEKMGAEIHISHGYIEASTKGLKAAEISMPIVSVGATEQTIIAATLAKGTTKIINAAKEPEVVDLANFINAMGGKVSGAGTSTITIEGVTHLKETTYSISSDRLDALSYMVATIATGGHANITNVNVEQISDVVEKVQHTGAVVDIINNNSLYVATPSNGALVKSVDIITGPYPGFPTDLQAIWAALMLKADGTSIINETIFENRLSHIHEMKRFGANVNILGPQTVAVTGVKDLSSAEAKATDLRASFALIITAMMSDGVSVINDSHHIFRGYENFVEKFHGCGGDIEIKMD